MERWLADAEKISGVHYDISNLNDVFNAIHVIQQELNVTGTTAKEASTTISGSIASAKSAFSNFLSGAGGIEEVISTFTTAGTNISNAIIKMAPQIITGLTTLLNNLIPLIVHIRIYQSLPNQQYHNHQLESYTNTQHAKHKTRQRTQFLVPLTRHIPA